MRIEAACLQAFCPRFLRAGWVAACLVVAGVVAPLAVGQVCPSAWQAGAGPAFPGVNGAVNTAVEWDPDGDGPLPSWLVVGGTFTVAGDVFAQNIAGWDGERWHAFGAGISLGTQARVDQVIAYNGSLYMRGYDGYAFFFGRWNGSAWQWSPMGVSPSLLGPLCVHAGELAYSVNGRVYNYNGSRSLMLNGVFSGRPRLFSHAGTLYAYGFESISGQAIRDCAYYDGAAWRAMGNPHLSSSTSPSMATIGDDLVLGSSFIYFTNPAGMITQSGEAIRWNGTGWTTIVSSMSPSIISLYTHNGALYAVGDGMYSFGTLSSQVWQWNGSLFRPVGNLAFAGAVNGLCSFRGELCAYGSEAEDFQWTAGRPHRYGNIARLTGEGWRPLGPGLTEETGDGSYRAAAVFQNRLYSGGTFSVGAPRTFGLAEQTSDGWRPLGAGLRYRSVPANLAGTGFLDRYQTPFVRSLLVWNGKLIVGGRFDLAGELDSRNVAAWDGQAWSRLADGLGGDSEFVTNLGTLSGELVATTQYPTPTYYGSRLNRWRDGRWSVVSLDPGWSVGLWLCFQDRVFAMEYPPQPGVRTRLAAFDGHTWTRIDAGLPSAPTDMWVVAGQLQCATDGGLQKWRWDGAQWSAEGTVNSRLASAVGSDGRRYYHDASRVYTYEGGVMVPVTGTFTGTLGTLTSFDGRLVAMGAFTAAGGTPASGYATMVAAPMEIHVTAPDTIVGAAVQISARVRQTSRTPRYEWSRNGQVIDSETGGSYHFHGFAGVMSATTMGEEVTVTLSIPHVAFGDSGSYTVEFTDECGSRTSNSVMFRVIGGCNPADLAGQGGVPGPDGVLNASDAQVFIDYFFANDGQADMPAPGVLTRDGVIDQNDFVSFLYFYFRPC